jgi:hypothetical protein
MSSLTDVLTQSLQGNTLDRLGARLGTDPQMTAAAVSAALPMLVGALARNSSTDSGAQALSAALARDHDGSVLDDLGGFLGGGASAAGAGILGHLFGGRQGAVEQAVAQSSGLDGAAAGQLMAMLAPLVMGALGRSARQQQGGLDPSVLAGMLGGEQASLAQRAPDAMGMLGQLLDSNKDGSIVDDLGRLASRFFASGSSR